MRCRTCEHILWRQPPAPPGEPRPCSECGTPYRVQDYAFVRGRVRFGCPHCGASYYGTSAKGHLEPIAFECVECRAFIHMDECMLEPIGPDDGASAMLDQQIPWIEERGILARWWKTVVVGAIRPRTIPAGLAGPTKLGLALGFLLVQSLIPVVAWTCCSVTLASFVFLPPPVGGAPPFPLLPLPCLMVGMLGPIFNFMFAFGAAAMLWALSRGSRASFTRDLERICYASGPLLGTAIPLYGLPLYLWWAVSSIVALTASEPKNREVSATGAVIAALVLPFFISISILFLV